MRSRTALLVLLSGAVAAHSEDPPAFRYVGAVQFLGERLKSPIHFSPDGKWVGVQGRLVS